MWQHSSKAVVSLQAGLSCCGCLLHQAMRSAACSGKKINMAMWMDPS